MTPGAFRKWQEFAGLNIEQAGKALGKSRHTIMRYRTAGVPAAESRTVRLAIRAIANMLPPWPDDDVAETKTGRE